MPINGDGDGDGDGGIGTLSVLLGLASLPFGLDLKAPRYEAGKFVGGSPVSVFSYIAVSCSNVTSSTSNSVSTVHTQSGALHQRRLSPRRGRIHLPSMAPHALTPTVEESERFEENYGFLQDEHAESHEMLAPRPAHSSGLVDDADTTQPYDISTRADGHFVANDATTCGEDRIDDPSPNVSYEAAYVDGYKEGYKDSHIALQHRPIAIVGMSCRFPGNVSTPDEFWELLARCRSGFSPIPPSRFSANRFFHPNPGKSGTTNARGGNFLTHDMAAFDAPFFGFTQQEAVSLDPQQRLLLECTFEALEGAGMPMHNIVGKDIGVFVGGTFSEYEADSFRDPETIPMHQATGM